MNPFDLVKNMQNLQGQMEKMKEELAEMTATGSSGGNMVQVTLNGKFEMVGIKIDPIAVDPRDVPMLQDLIVAANHDAMEKVQELIKQKSGSLFGGMNIPGLNL
ncbi:MAG: YbaB/EbfC family nucleoid-associated protein [Treponema sp.]|nr:YbaB/EbfC family nucleoid-associated protein [Treponema sp.]MBR4464543.1 YbaB/EbfC family nucleoid-associated protein [Treponema sp.]